MVAAALEAIRASWPCVECNNGKGNDRLGPGPSIMASPSARCGEVSGSAPDHGTQRALCPRTSSRPPPLPAHVVETSQTMLHAWFNKIKPSPHSTGAQKKGRLLELRSLGGRNGNTWTDFLGFLQASFWSESGAVETRGNDTGQPVVSSCTISS